jgi:hypothetical protein
MPSNSGTTIRLILSLGFFQEGTYPTGILAEECFDILGIVGASRPRTVREEIGKSLNNAPVRAGPWQKTAATLAGHGSKISARYPNQLVCQKIVLKMTEL